MALVQSITSCVMLTCQSKAVPFHAEIGDVFSPSSEIRVRHARYNFRGLKLLNDKLLCIWGWKENGLVVELYEFASGRWKVKGSALLKSSLARVSTLFYGSNAGFLLGSELYVLNIPTLELRSSAVNVSVFWFDTNSSQFITSDQGGAMTEAGGRSVLIGASSDGKYRVLGQANNSGIHSLLAYSTSSSSVASFWTSLMPTYHGLELDSTRSYVFPLAKGALVQVYEPRQGVYFVWRYDDSTGSLINVTRIAGADQRSCISSLAVSGGGAYALYRNFDGRVWKSTTIKDFESGRMWNLRLCATGITVFNQNMALAVEDRGKVKIVVGKFPQGRRAGQGALGDLGSAPFSLILEDGSERIPVAVRVEPVFLSLARTRFDVR